MDLLAVGDLDCGVKQCFSPMPSGVVSVTADTLALHKAFLPTYFRTNSRASRKSLHTVLDDALPSFGARTDDRVIAPVAFVMTTVSPDRARSSLRIPRLGLRCASPGATQSLKIRRRACFASRSAARSRRLSTANFILHSTHLHTGTSKQMFRSSQKPNIEGRRLCVLGHSFSQQLDGEITAAASVGILESAEEIAVFVHTLECNLDVAV